jgi:hypothetical protein
MEMAEIELNYAMYATAIVTVIEGFWFPTI